MPKAQTGESFDVGMDNGSPASESYRPPFAYAGTIRKVQIHLAPSRLSSSEQEQIRDATRQIAMGVERSIPQRTDGLVERLIFGSVLDCTDESLFKA